MRIVEAPSPRPGDPVTSFAKRLARVSSRTIGRGAKQTLLVTHRGDPVPLQRLMRIRRALRGENVLAPTYRQARRSARDLKDPELTQLLSGEELGTWALGPKTIDLIGREIKKRQPQLILELGSGISTVCLAHFMSEVHGRGDRVRVVSIEQSQEMTDRTIERLEAAALDRIARVVTKELTEQTIEHQGTTCYDLSDLGGILPGLAEMVLIDGPAGPAGVRFGTLPLVAPHCVMGARFFLDDALRDGELDIARSWSNLRGVEIEGIVPLETGLLIGSIRT